MGVWGFGLGVWSLEFGVEVWTLGFGGFGGVEFGVMGLHDLVLCHLILEFQIQILGFGG